MGRGERQDQDADLMPRRRSRLRSWGSPDWEAMLGEGQALVAVPEPTLDPTSNEIDVRIWLATGVAGLWECREEIALVPANPERQ